MLVLDTNVYIDARSDPARLELLSARIEDANDKVAVSSVVVAEFLLGQDQSDADVAAIQALFFGEIVTPTHEDWIIAAEGLRLLGGHAVTTRRSFWNDLLIAASCVRTGAMLMTSNERDFKRIRSVIPVQTIPAW